MKKNTTLARASIIIILNAILISALISMFLVDKLVNELLYDYGLVFSLNWAEPYWLMMRTSMAMIVIVIVVFTLLEILYPVLHKES